MYIMMKLLHECECFLS